MPSAIFLPKWTELVVILYNTPPKQRYCEKIHRRTGMTIRHLRSLVNGLERMGIVIKEDEGKIKYIRLTDSGVSLAEALLEIYPALKR
jgi:predicted transcriptional regulator